jgi:hypothetical protein
MPAVLFLTALTACAATPITGTACSAFRPITYSAAKDTPETVAQVRKHNAAWEALCK